MPAAGWDKSSFLRKRLKGFQENRSNTQGGVGSGQAAGAEMVGWRGGGDGKERGRTDNHTVAAAFMNTGFQAVPSFHML